MPTSSVFPKDALFANAYLGARPIVDAVASRRRRRGDGTGGGCVVVRRAAGPRVRVGVGRLGPAGGRRRRRPSARVQRPGDGRQLQRAVVGSVRSAAHRLSAGRSGVRTGAVITKPDGTGGMVTFDTVREQLLYEVHDPARYLNPDVTADFTSLTLTDLGDDRVRVSDTRGTPAPETYKGLVCTPAGWASECRVVYTWPDAEAKARAALDFVKARRRCRRRGRGVVRGVLRRQRVRRPNCRRPRRMAAPEVIGRLAWRTADQQSAAAVGREMGVLGLRSPWHFGNRSGRRWWQADTVAGRGRLPCPQSVGRHAGAHRRGDGGVTRIQLVDLCGARCGDKGDISDLSLFADDEAAFEAIRAEVTAERVKAHFGALVKGEVVRFTRRPMS